MGRFLPQTGRHPSGWRLFLWIERRKYLVAHVGRDAAKGFSPRLDQPVHVAPYAKAFHVRTRQRSGERQAPENPWLNPRRVGIEAMEPARGLTVEGQPGVVQPVVA